MARVGSFRRGKVCQNRGGITGPREKRTRRLRDIDFIALATNFARVGFFHTKKKPRFCAVLSPKYDPPTIFKNHGHRWWKSEAFNKSKTVPRSRFSPEAEFRTKDPISDYYHDIISTERGRSAKRSAERRARDDRDREKVCNSWNNREGKWIFSPAIPSNRGNSNNRP